MFLTNEEIRKLLEDKPASENRYWDGFQWQTGARLTGELVGQFEGKAGTPVGPAKVRSGGSRKYVAGSPGVVAYPARKA